MNILADESIDVQIVENLRQTDKDFGELVYRQKLVANGVLLIRLAGLSPQTKAIIVTRAMLEHGEDFRHSFSVLAPAILRIRKPLSS